MSETETYPPPENPDTSGCDNDQLPVSETDSSVRQMGGEYRDCLVFAPCVAVLDGAWHVTMRPRASDIEPHLQAFKQYLMARLTGKLRSFVIDMRSIDNDYCSSHIAFLVGMQKFLAGKGVSMQIFCGGRLAGRLNASDLHRLFQIFER